MAKKRNSSCGTKAGNPKRAAQVANQNTGFSLTLEKMESIRKLSKLSVDKNLVPE